MSKRFDELFGEIVTILRRDYAGADLVGERLDPRYYNQSIGQAWHDDKLDELLFLRHVSQMLACTGDRHLHLELQPSEHYTPWSPGFFTRRYENALYVTAVTDEDRLVPGDRITAVNGGTPAAHRANIQKNFFYADTPEREDWHGMLKMADSIDVERSDGSRERLALARHPRRSPKAAPQVYDAKGGVILDLRNAADIPDGLFRELLSLVCRRDTPLRELADGDVYVNYTRFNCLVKAAGLESVEGAEGYLRELREKAGKGLLFEPDEDDTILPGHAGGAAVVLTDTWTRDGAEALSLAAKRAGAYLIGRPTLGTIDLCGDVHYALDERYVLTWPTAIAKAASEGRGVFGRGVAPDRYIPWTPEECRRDLLLDAAIEYIAAKT